MSQTSRQSAVSSDLLTRLLSQVSRSFYRTLRILPATVRRQISLTYLLARTTDTIADTKLLPVSERLEALARLRRRISGQDPQPLDGQMLAQDQATAAERELLSRVEEAFCLLDAMNEADARDIREVLDVITGGQELDLRRFAYLQPGEVHALQTDDDLDDYTWRVAGCVGRFWTRICRRHLFPRAEPDEETMIRDGVRLGKGLQLVNILRDLATDLRQGRCYLPEDRLRQAELKPIELLSSNAETRVRPVVDHFIAVAEAHLAAGWRYTNALPRSQRRLRLACAWPILIGVATLKALKSSPALDPEHRVKISRPHVYRILWRSVHRLPRPAAWERQFEEASSSQPGILTV